jgi:YidC/Oxa1 family membrane protein insertase
MEKRVLIAIILSIAFMYGYSFLFPPPKPPVPPKAATPPGAAAVPAASGPAAEPVPQLPASQSKQAVAAREVLVDTDDFTAVIDTRGGSLKRVVLKKFKNEAGPSGKEIVLIQEEQARNFSLISSYPGFSAGEEPVFVSTVDRLNVTGTESKKLELSLSLASGVHVKKSFTFTGTGYGITLDQTLVNGSAQQREGEANLVLNHRSVKPKEDSGRDEVFGPVTMAEKGVSFDSIGDLAKEKTYGNGLAWSGFGDKYFLSALLVKGGQYQSVVLKDANGYLTQRFVAPKLRLAPGQSLSLESRVYIGPKDIDLLKAQGAGLEEAIDLGWFSAIAKPMLLSLKALYRYLHNYGWAIVVITIVLKILFFPLTHKSYKSMKEMQKLQPRMVELKEKHKDDRDALNRAVMELYKANKVNPLGGCLPMIVQIPVFFGLYKALMFSIELRHAPFMFWLQDLSAKDPYYVTPLIMGATMFIQQKMTPTNMDPIQAKMMLALPVIFTFMFLNFPSGLVLYWLVNNILTIAQQAYINHSLKEA